MIHMSVTGAGALCGGPSTARISLVNLVRFHPLTCWVMRLFGCRGCGDALREALRTARLIR